MRPWGKERRALPGGGKGPRFFRVLFAQVSERFRRGGLAAEARALRVREPGQSMAQRGARYAGAASAPAPGGPAVHAVLRRDARIRVARGPGPV